MRRTTPGQKYKTRNYKRRVPNSKIVRKPRNTFGSNAIPVSTTQVLTYEDLLTLSPGSPRTQYTFRGNSLFDPDYTSTGHQPRYFDTYAAIYERYRVTSSRVTLDLINGNATSGVIYTILPHTDVITTTSWQAVAELPQAKVSQIVPIASRYPMRLSHRQTTSRVCGLQRREILDQDYSAAVGSNPINLWYWNIGIESVDGATNIGISFRVRLEYTATFYERAETGLSIVRNPEEKHEKQPRVVEKESQYEQVVLEEAVTQLATQLPMAVTLTIRK